MVSPLSLSFLQCWGLNPGLTCLQQTLCSFALPLKLFILLRCFIPQNTLKHKFRKIYWNFGNSIGIIIQLGHLYNWKVMLIIITLGQQAQTWTVQAESRFIMTLYQSNKFRLGRQRDRHMALYYGSISDTQNRSSVLVASPQCTWKYPHAKPWPLCLQDSTPPPGILFFRTVLKALNPGGECCFSLLTSVEWCLCFIWGLGKGCHSDVTWVRASQTQANTDVPSL